MYALEQLEYNKFKKIISAHCHSALGKKKAMTLAPLQNPEAIKEKSFLIREIQACLTETDFSFLHLKETKQLLLNFQHQTFNFEECKRIVSNVFISNIISEELPQIKCYPLLTTIIEKLNSFPDIEKRYKEIFDADGAILDSASPLLRSIRSQKVAIRKNIIQTLQQNLEDYTQQKFVQEAIITQREGRFVVPLKEGSVSFVRGIVHGRSGSKASIYMEPENVIQMNNHLEIANNEEKQEIFRIMQEFTKIILSNKDELVENEERLTFLDFHFAAARWAKRVRAVVPDLGETPYIKLLQARHPLLIETYGSLEKVVSLDVELGKDFKLLVISGPNTGGKTVTLKTIGLLCLIGLSGLPIPAEENSVIYPFQHIFADIGDLQSLENALSTFSSHIKIISEITRLGNEHSLALIDEIGAATDPEQGSALAQAILEDVTEKKILGIITTHYTSLKLFAENHLDCCNAAMQFDPKKHIPTYQFKLGLPGDSFAIEVASNLGFPEALILRAKELTGVQSMELTGILKKMNEEKMALSRQLYEYQLKTSLLNKKIEEYQVKIADWEVQSKVIRKQSLQEARSYLINIQNELNLELEEIRKKGKDKREIEKAIQKVAMQNKEISADLQELKPIELESIKKPKIGAKVWLSELETEGEIVEFTKDMVKIDLDGMIFTTDWNKVFQIKEEKQLSKKPAMNTEVQIQAKLELNIIGYRFDDALPILEKFMDSAEFRGLEKVRIVHGKGTGALRAKVRQYLKQRKKVKDFYTPASDAGGDGVTIAVIG
jgi:DNA mismatch repair protein MutS2